MESNRKKDKGSISAVYVSVKKRTMLKIGIEKKTNINTVLLSTIKLDTNSKISFVLCTKLGFSCTTIQIVRV